MAKKALRGVKQLDFDALEAAESHQMKHLEHWPEWVQFGLGYVRKALSSIGVEVDFDDIKDPGEYLDELIALVKKSPATSFTKWLALAALEYLHKFVHPDHILKALKGAA